MLSNSELSDMRSTIQDYLLPDTCNIISITRTSDSSGGFTEAWGTATASAACRLDTQNGKYMNLDGSVRTYKMLILSLPYNTTITTGNRVQYDGNTYQVLMVNEGSWLAVRRAEVEQI